MALKIQTATLGAFGVNIYAVTDQATGAQALIDTSETRDVIELLDQNNVVPAQILMTHAHLDHAGALSWLLERFDATTYLPRDEKQMFEALPQQGDWFQAPQLNRPLGRIDTWLVEGDTVTIGETTLKVLSTPGHSPGMVCYYDDTDIFVGDTVFAGGIGRTDLPLCSPKAMRESLKKLFQLPGHLRAHTGHGPPTTLERELKTNPFLGFLRGEADEVAW
jgi:glyoxylase-like metal-dependent hydrolase (beta-lactamase superfamily II)